MTKLEELKFLEEKKLKILKEKEKIEQKLSNDFKLFNDRINMICSELKSNRSLENAKMIHKHKCVAKEIDTNQKLEISNLDKITKGISSNLFYFRNFLNF